MCASQLRSLCTRSLPAGLTAGRVCALHGELNNRKGGRDGLARLVTWRGPCERVSLASGRTA